MSEPQNGRRRRLLLAAVSGTVLLSACAPRRSVQEPERAPAPSLQPVSTSAAATVFLTLSSPSRPPEALEHMVNAILLPALAPARIAHAYGPVEMVVQLWCALEPDSLAHYRLSPEQGVALLADAVGGIVAPMPGRHALPAWALHRPDATRMVEAGTTSIALPGHPYAPLFALGSFEYAKGPPAWANQASITVLLQSQRRLYPGFEAECTRLLQTSSASLPEDVEVQIGAVVGAMADASSVYVQLGPFQPGE